MKTIYHLLITVAFIINSSHFLLAHNHQTSPQPQNTNFCWWPQSMYQNTQNNITVTVKALSEEETKNLFLGNGQRLVSMRGYLSISQPIVPLYITIKNGNPFSIMLSDQDINLGRNWNGSKRRPLNIRNTLEALNNNWFWSKATTCKTIDTRDSNGKIIESNNTYEKNTDSLFHRSFLSIDKLDIPTLFNLEPSMLFNDIVAQSSIIVKTGKTKGLLLFVWGKEITSSFNITIAKTTFNINFKT